MAIIVLFILTWIGRGNLFAQERVGSGDIQVSVSSSGTLNSFFREIEKQTIFHFVYSKEDVNRKLPVRVTNPVGKLCDILDQVLLPLGLTYRISNKYISISLNRVAQSPVAQSAVHIPLDYNFIKIAGIILDANGEPVIGASLKERGTKRGAISDLFGEFNMQVSPGAKIDISYLGYEPRTISVNNETYFQVILKEELRMLDEIIVVGYGVQKRLNLTGSIFAVSNKEITQSHRPDMTSGLAGLIPGVRTVQKSGRPGADGSEFDIRGYGSPLIIVDGVERPFSQIDPNEVESVTVLKDASASVYGFKGANGVLLVTTKKGRENKTQINYSFNYGIQKITDYPKFMNGVEYATYIDEAAANMNQPIRYGKERIAQIAAGTDPDYVNTDWNKELLRKSAPMQQHNLNISGGNRAIKYFMSVGYLNQDGIIRTKDNYKRYNFRSNISTIIAENLTAEMQLGGRSERRDAPSSFENGAGSTDHSAFDVFKQLAMAIPVYRVYANDNSNYYQFISGNSINPVALVDRNVVGTYYNQFDEFNGQFTLNYDIPFVKGLSLKAMLAYDRQLDNAKNYAKAWSLYSYNSATDIYHEQIQRGINTLEEIKEDNSAFNQQYSVNYKNVFNKKHEVSGMLLLEARKQEYSRSQIKGDIDVDGLPELDAVNSSNLTTGGNSYRTAYMGLVGRFSYSYSNKYMAEFSFREDGSYKFAKDKRWGFFPAIFLGWRISEEKFVTDRTHIFNNLKLRFSYGKVGDDSGADATNRVLGYDYSGAWSGFVMGDNNIIIGAADRGLINMYLTWYKVTMTNLGLDASLWNGKLYAEFELFYRKRTGLLTRRSVSLPSIMGALFPQENINGDNNRGFEMVLGTRQRIGDLTFDVKGTLSYSRAKTDYQEISMPGNDYENWRGPSSWVQRSPYRWTNIAWGYTAVGQFKSYEEILHSPIQDSNGNTTLMPGDIKYKDLNGDGVIDRWDESPIGRSGTPDLFFGVNTSMNWKNIDFTMLFQGATCYTYAFNYKQPFLQSGMGGGYKMYEDRWHRVDNSDLTSEWIPGRFPPLRIEGYSGNEYISTFWNINATYLRLKMIELGYTLPASVTRKACIQKIRFYANGYNLVTFKNRAMKGVDPEGESGYGLFYPQMKSYNFGVNVTF